MLLPVAVPSDEHVRLVPQSRVDLPDVTDARSFNLALFGKSNCLTASNASTSSDSICV